MLNELPEYFRLAVPSLIYYSSIWFCSEIYVLAAGNLSLANQACTSIAVSIISTHDAMCDGGIQGTCAYIGSEIATMRISFAKRSYREITLLEMSINIVLVALLTAYNKQIAYFYAPKDEELRDLLQIALPIAGIVAGCKLGTQVGAIFALAIQKHIALPTVGFQCFLVLPIGL